MGSTSQREVGDVGESALGEVLVGVMGLAAVTGGGVAPRHRRRASFCEMRNRIRNTSGQDFAPILAGVLRSLNAVIAAYSTVGNRLRASCTPEHTCNNSAGGSDPHGRSRTPSIAARNAPSLATTDEM